MHAPLRESRGSTLTRHRQVRVDLILLTLLLSTQLAPGGALGQTGVTTERARVVVMPADIKAVNDRSLVVLDLVIEEMSRLGRFNVIDRRTTLQALQEFEVRLSGLVNDDNAIEIGKFLSSNIGVVVTLNDQRTNNHFDAGKTHYEAYVSIGIKQLDIEKGETLNSFSITGTSDKTHETTGEAVQASYTDLRTKLSEKLRELYPLRLMVLAREGKRVTLLGGRNLGLKPKMVFEVFVPDRTEMVGGVQVRRSGRRQGLILITGVDEETAEATVLWGYRRINVEQIAKEQIGSLARRGAVIPMFSLHPASGGEIGALFLEAGAYLPTTFGLRIGFGSAPDDRDDQAGLLQLGFALEQKFFRSSLLDLGINEGAFALKAGGLQDDAGNEIQKWTWQVFGGSYFNLYFTDNIILTAAADYYLGGKFEEWFWYGRLNPDDTEEEENWHPAVWTGAARRIDLGGLTFTIGLKLVF